jgi:hypothetical protein
MALNQKRVEELLASGNYLGSVPLFDVKQMVKYQFASYSQVGYFAPDLSTQLKNVVFKVVDMRQRMIGLPVMSLVWEYEVIELPVTAGSRSMSLLEPQLKKM